MPDLSEFVITIHHDSLWLIHNRCGWESRMGTRVHLNVLMIAVDQHMDECTKKD